MPSIVDRVPDQSGRTAFITGGTRGLGFELAAALVRAGATVLVSGRDEKSGATAVAKLRDVSPGTDVEFLRLDLADLTSVAAVAETLSARTRLDLLINNAGVMAPPLGFSIDGYESQWATNVIGPFALTARLLPLVARTAGSRVVTVSSVAHRMPPFDVQRARLEIQGTGYIPFLVYGHTKLADILLARELDRCLRDVGSSTLSVAAHPGVAGTDIAAATFSAAPTAVKDAAVAIWRSVTPPPSVAMQSLLTAAIAPLVRGGDMIGPRGLGQSRGVPARVSTSAASRDADLGRELVGWLEQLTGVRLDP